MTDLRFAKSLYATDRVCDGKNLIIDGVPFPFYIQDIHALGLNTFGNGNPTVVSVTFIVDGDVKIERNLPCSDEESHIDVLRTAYRVSAEDGL